MAQNITDRVDNPAEAGVSRYVGLEHIDPQSLRLTRWGLPTDVEATKLRFLPGDIIFGKRRAYQRKLAVADFEGICSAHAMVLRAKREAVLDNYLPVFLQSELFFERALKISVGGLSPTINWRELAKQEFLLPPKDDQRRIADLLGATENLRLTYLAALAESNAVLDSLRSEHFAPNRHRAASIPLESVADVSYGLTLNARRRGLPNQLPYLRVANVQRWIVDLSDVKRTGATDAEVVRSQLEDGDLLVVEGHAVKAEVGRAAMFRDGGKVFLHQNHLIRVRCSGPLNPSYALEAINSQKGREYFWKVAKSTSGLNTINSQVIRDFPIAVPSESDQRSFLEQLGGVMSVRALLEAHRGRIATFRTAIESLVWGMGT